jgi:hypothetical protein
MVRPIEDNVVSNTIDALQSVVAKLGSPGRIQLQALERGEE